MSYAGVYGPDETCVHDCYIRNCWRCNGRVEQFAREYPAVQQHPGLAQAITISVRTVEVYSASCPSPACGWTRHAEFDRAKVEADIQAHIKHCQEVASSWADASDIKAEAQQRRLL